MVTKKFTRKELVSRNSTKDAVFVIDNIVYDVTKFLDEHPGGHEVLVEKAGGDATEGFDDIGHSNDAKELMKKYIIGEVVEEDRIVTQKRSMSWSDNNKNDTSSGLSSIVIPIILGIIATIIYRIYFD